MALTVTRSCNRLDTPFVLAPERYDPRRSLTAQGESILLGEITLQVKDIVQPDQYDGPSVILDTSDAREGIIVSKKRPSLELGSAKKAVNVGDVIISRLRPYLRQVAYIDPGIDGDNKAPLLCSTEFFVLRSRGTDSIAFLVPFLLSKEVQKALAASQEGGHHPRFHESTLLSLPIPMLLISDRKAISEEIERAARMYRESQSLLQSLFAVADAAFLGLTGQRK